MRLRKTCVCIMLCVAALLSAVSAKAQMSCGGRAGALASLDEPELQGALLEQITAGRLECTEDEVKRESIARASINGPTGWDSRFALREAVYAVVKNPQVKQQERLGLLQAAVTASLRDSVQRRPEDLQADTYLVMLTLSTIQGNCADWMAMLLLAARVDQHTPTALRDANVAQGTLSLFPCRFNGEKFFGIDQFVDMERVTRGDSSLAQWRFNLAYYDLAYPGPIKGTADEQRLQAHKLVRLVDDLADVPTSCDRTCFPWQWRPLWYAAQIFHDFGDPAADATKQRVLSIVGTMSDKVGKSRALKDICQSMVYDHFPEEEYRPIVEQIKSLKGATDDTYPVRGPCQ